MSNQHHMDQEREKSFCEVDFENSVYINGWAAVLC